MHTYKVEAEAIRTLVAEPAGFAVLLVTGTGSVVECKAVSFSVERGSAVTRVGCCD